MGYQVKRARLELHGSIAATKWEHRTDVALIAGLLDMAKDDERTPDALDLARAAGLEYTFAQAYLGDVHPNSVRIYAEGDADSTTVAGSSICVRRINIFELNLFEVSVD